MRFCNFFFLSVLVAGLFFAGPSLRAQTAPPAVLERGNKWVRGLPALEQNAFPALFGAYRAGKEEFSVWICAEPLLFAQDTWKPAAVPGYAARERTTADGRYAALELGNGYTALFLFPVRGGPPPADQSRLVRAWAARFLYFVRTAHRREDISLPAVVEY